MLNLIEYNANLLEESRKDEEYSKIFYDKFTSAQKRISEYINMDDIVDQDRYNEYTLWMTKYKLLLQEYGNFLKCCKINPNKFKKDGSIELFKGALDSLKFQFPCLKIYSQYGSTFNLDDKKMCILSNDITVNKGVPTYKLFTELGTKILLPTSPNPFTMYYMHNPYNKREENKINKLLENEDLSIVYGLFGYCQEEDIDNKIDELRNIKSNLPDSHFFELKKDDLNLGSFHIGLVYRPSKDRVEKQNKNRH